MKKIYSILALLALSLSFLASCTETTTPTSTKVMSDYFPIADGYFWIYSTDTTNSNYEKIKNLNNYKLNVNKSTVVAGKSCFEVFGDGDTTYYYTTASSVYFYSTSPISSYEETEAKYYWFERYNVNKEITTANVDTTMEILGFNMKMKLVAKSKPISTTGSYIYKSNSYETIQFEETINMEMSIVEMPTYKSTVESKTTITFAKGIGVVKVLEYTKSFDPNDGTIEGYKRTDLTNTNVK